MKKFNYFFDDDDRVEEILRKGQYLDSGNHGVIYRIDDNSIVKFFCEEDVFEKELFLLRQTKDCDAYPELYHVGGNYIVREYIKGERLDKYLKENPKDKEVYTNIIKLLKKLRKIGFQKIDLRLRDIYVQKDKSLRVIDPKNNHTKRRNYPKHLMKNLKSIGLLDEFFHVLKKYDKKLYKLWKYSYLKKDE